MENNTDRNREGEKFFELDAEQGPSFTIAICIIHGLLCFTALIGNSAILITIWKTSSLHSAVLREISTY